jgi:hypothetical protein
VERPAARLWSVWRGRGAGRPPASGLAGALRTSWRPEAPPGEAPGAPWSAVLHLGGARTLEASYRVDPPLLIGAPLPRVAVRSLPSTPAFSLDLRLPTPASLLYVGVLGYTDSRSRPGRARIAGTWSAPNTTFWGTWIGAASQRGTIRLVLREL